MVAHCCENRGYVRSYGVDLLLGFLLYFGYVLLLAWMECADRIGTVVETAASNVQTFCAGAVLYQVCRLFFSEHGYGCLTVVDWIYGDHVPGGGFDRRYDFHAVSSSVLVHPCDSLYCKLPFDHRTGLI